ncbi:MAG: 30S ribosomal protein S6 [Candidatus Omnitrophota bacterium]
MNNYEAMFLIDTNLDDKGIEALCNQVIKEAILKNGGDIVSSGNWAEKRKLHFPIKKRQEATYHLVNFNLPPDSVDKIKQVYRLNESILRVLITKIE